MLSTTSVSVVGSADQRCWISISGRSACISGPMNWPCGGQPQLLAARRAPARTTAASWRPASATPRRACRWRACTKAVISCSADEFEHAARRTGNGRPPSGARRTTPRRCRCARRVMYFTCIARIGDDGADAHPVAPRERRVRHAVDALLVRQHALVLGVDGQALAAARDEVERPLPLLVASDGGSDQALRTSASSCSGAEAAAQRHRHQVLHQHVERLVRHAAAPSMRRAITACCAPAASTSSRLLVGTSVTRETRPGAWPLRPARCSRRAMPLALPICSTRSTGRKSTPEVEAGGADHRLQLALLQAQSRPSRAPRGRASRGAARSGRPSRAALRACSGTRARPASACW